MIGPTTTPRDYMPEGEWSHLVVNDISELMTAYDRTGVKLWQIPCLARGQGGEMDWLHKGTDTPPGIYKLGQLYDDIAVHGERPTYTNDQMMSYGWQSYDMVSLDGNEERSGRAGIMLHGGGTANGWPGAWAARQHLLPTLGCVRIYNIDLRDKVQPLWDRGTVFVSVYQEG
jgi:hypothetical protein